MRFSGLSRNLTNRAFVFVKPHASIPAVYEQVPSQLNRFGVDVLQSGKIDSADLQSGVRVDRHYASIARYAMLPSDQLAEVLETWGETFKASFGYRPRELQAQNRLLNLPDALNTFRWSAEDLKTRFNAICWKLGPGIYVAQFDGLVVVNGFYGRLREKFTAAGANIRWFVAEFDPVELPWSRFRETVVGSTDPSKASEGSLRAELLRCSEDYGLSMNKQDNGFHASTGPLEALAEQVIWTDCEISSDPFGHALEEMFGATTAKALLHNPLLRLPDKRCVQAFDMLEEIDSPEDHPSRSSKP